MVIAAIGDWSVEFDPDYLFDNDLAEKLAIQIYRGDEGPGMFFKEDA